MNITTFPFIAKIIRVGNGYGLIIPAKVIRVLELKKYGIVSCSIMKTGFNEAPKEGRVENMIKVRQHINL